MMTIPPFAVISLFHPPGILRLARCGH
ncbi:hypothetical protein RSAG8_10409, partial [Rhizoctonia solani AG-8 WAC10335]